MIRYRSQYSGTPVGGKDLSPVVVMCNEIKKSSANKSTGFTWLIFFVLLFISVLGKAQEQQESIEFNIRSQQADKGLKTFGRQADVTVLYRFGVIKKYQTNKLIGNYTIAQAIDILLKNTQLTGQLDQSGNLLIKEKQQSQTEDENMIPGTKRTLIAAAIAASLSPSVNAQEQQASQAESETEVIEVRGIWSSLEKSMAIKQDATGFVDAISSEDVGKLPDQNVAEALQRITGVSIQRNRGEGDFVSIRGLGPDFVRGTVNGRSLLSATEFVDPNINGGIDTSTGRAANFDVLPSEMISTLEVVKSASAKHVEGGIGGVVNVRTARPLAMGNKVVGSVQGVYRDFNEETDPIASVLGSWKNDEDTFGILTTLAYSERNIREDYTRTFGYFPSSAVGTTGPFDLNNDGVTDNVTSIPFPLSNNLESIDEERERLTISSTLQWRPDENTELSVDVLYSDREISSSGSNFIFLPIPFAADLAGQTVNPDGSIQVGNLVTNGGFSTLNTTLRPEATTDLQQAEDDVISVGVNFSKVIEEWTLTADLSYSKAEGTNDFTRARYDANNGTFNFTTTVANDEFIINQNNFDANNPATSLGNTDNYVLSLFDLRAAVNEDKETAFQLDALREIESDVISSIEMGIRVRKREKFRTATRKDTVVGSAGILATNAGFNRGASNFLDGDFNASFAYNDIPFPNPASAISAYSATAGAESLTPVANPFGTYDIEEVTYATYFQLNLDGEIGGVPYVGDVGFRIVTTQQDISGFDAELRITDTGGQDTTSPDVLATGSATPFASNETYTNVLPSFNLRFELADDLFLRVAASETLTRPTFNDLQPGLTLNPNCSCDNNGDNFAIAATAGNPGLAPYEATNYDLGLEWYFGEKGAAYAGFFHKDLENYIAVVTNEQVSTLGSAPIRAVGIEQNGTSNPIPLDQVSQPDNQGEAEVTGLEIGYLQSFDNGFGYNLNASFTENSAEFTETGADIDFPGVSKNSYNATVFYENHGFSARLSYSYRGSYLLVPDGVGGLGSQIVAESYGQLDGSVSYEINENFTVFANAVNLNDEEQQLREEIPNVGSRFYSRSHIGPRFTLGVRGSF